MTMTSSMTIVLSSGRVTPQMKMAAGPRNGPDPQSLYGEVTLPKEILLLEK